MDTKDNNTKPIRNFFAFFFFFTVFHVIYFSAIVSSDKIWQRLWETRYLFLTITWWGKIDYFIDCGISTAQNRAYMQYAGTKYLLREEF